MRYRYKSHEAVRRLTVAAMLTAVASVLQFIEMPVPFLMPSFVKLDFSDLPALLGAFSLGPWWGVLIQLVKNLLHWPFGSSVGVGELCNFLLGSVFVLVAGLVYKRCKTRGNALLGAVLGALAMAIASLPLNYYLVYPAYVKIFHIPEEGIISMYEAILGNVAHVPTSNPLLNCLLIFNVTFTLVKGLLDMGLCMAIYKPLSSTLLEKGLFSEQKEKLSAKDYRRRKRNLWILIGTSIIMLSVQITVWAVRFIYKAVSYASIEDAFRDSVDVRYLPITIAGILGLVTGVVSFNRIRRRQEALIAEENAQEAKHAQDADPAEESANSDE